MELLPYTSLNIDISSTVLTRVHVVFALSITPGFHPLLDSHRLFLLISSSSPGSQSPKKLTVIEVGVVVIEKHGTEIDARDMKRMGKRQSFQRNFAFCSTLGFSVVLMSAWEIQASYHPQ